MIWNTLLLALREIRRNLLRSFLTVLGIVIGVSAVITMVTLGNGATRAISDQISAMGSNLLIVRPGQRLGPGSGSAGAAPFKPELVESVRSQMGSIQAVAPTVFKTVTVVVGNQNWSTTVTGSTNDYFVAGNWTLAGGREFTATELRAGRAVCLVGDTIRRELFGGGNPVGERVRINKFTCEVIGVLAPKGQSAFGSDQDDTIVMPLRTAQRRLTGSTDISRMMVSVNDGVSTDRAKGQLELLMRELRRIGDGEDDDFNVLDTKQIAQTLSSTTQVMTTLLGAVAAVSLLVGGIGIMNIMLVSVTERTREIGIRLAIGAMEKEVLLQFLIEAVVLACLGGLTGVVLATAASIGLSSLMNIPYLFDPGINLISFGFSALIGVVFGFFPARRAARLDPIDALRHE
ncbi:ABC transporter permease [Nitrogeniibacter aestuarii]|uniref:ABC transporter permease n=1 Tax=Nitrogeniibacter aestuarii TaxID=2815343 RepID=UPI001D0FE7A4|nr:ABC transporter permease [Nitrogeniibacter aestuarii]